MICVLCRNPACPSSRMFQALLTGMRRQRLRSTRGRNGGKRIDTRVFVVVATVYYELEGNVVLVETVEVIAVQSFATLLRSPALYANGPVVAHPNGPGSVETGSPFFGKVPGRMVAAATVN